MKQKNPNKITVAPFAMNFQQALSSMINGRDYLKEQGFESQENHDKYFYNDANYDFICSYGKIITDRDFSYFSQESGESIDMLLLELASESPKLKGTMTSMDGLIWDRLMDVVSTEMTNGDLNFEFYMRPKGFLPAFLGPGTWSPKIFSSNARISYADVMKPFYGGTIEAEGLVELKTGLHQAMNKTHLEYKPAEK